MAKNYSAYEAAQVIYGNNTEEIKEVGSRFPLFSRAVALDNSEYLLDILKALPKVTARIVETGLSDLEASEETEEEVKETKEEKKKEPKKEKTSKTKAKAKKEEVEEVETEEEETEQDYSTMTAKKLYELCCQRGLSSKCKKRDKNSLIAVLEEADGKGTEDEDEWDEEEQEEEKDPYAGKSAKELYGMCKKRKINCPTGKKADFYANLLKKADAEEQEEDTEEDEDEWEID